MPTNSWFERVLVVGFSDGWLPSGHGDWNVAAGLGFYFFLILLVLVLIRGIHRLIHEGWRRPATRHVVAFVVLGLGLAGYVVALGTATLEGKYLGADHTNVLPFDRKAWNQAGKLGGPPLEFRGMMARSVCQTLESEAKAHRATWIGILDALGPADVVDGSHALRYALGRTPGSSKHPVQSLIQFNFAEGKCVGFDLRAGPRSESKRWEP